MPSPPPLLYSRAIMPEHDELSLLRSYLGLALASLGEAPRKTEDRLGIGHGTLSRLLEGRIELKLRYLLDICRMLDIHPRDLIEAGFPDWKASHQLNDWMPVRVRKAAPLTSALSGEVLEAIRAVVREEISRADLANSGKPKKTRGSA